MWYACVSQCAIICYGPHAGPCGIACGLLCGAVQLWFCSKHADSAAEVTGTAMAGTMTALATYVPTVTPTRTKTPTRTPTSAPTAVPTCHPSLPENPVCLLCLRSRQCTICQACCEHYDAVSCSGATQAEWCTAVALYCAPRPSPTPRPTTAIPTKTSTPTPNGPTAVPPTATPTSSIMICDGWNDSDICIYCRPGSSLRNCLTCLRRCLANGGYANEWCRALRQYCKFEDFPTGTGTPLPPHPVLKKVAPIALPTWLKPPTPTP